MCFERPIVNLLNFLGIQTYYGLVGIKAIGKKKQIGFTFIEVKPSFFRAAIEEYLIQKYSDSLPWNKVGKINNKDVSKKYKARSRAKP